jgi:hypothetical protein
VKAKPTKAPRATTEPTLDRSSWWRIRATVEQAGRKHAGSPGSDDWEPIWRRLIEPAAFRFEVLRRNGFEHLPPWPDLPEHILSFVVGALQEERPKAIWRLYPTEPSPGWSTVNPCVWNLHASDEALCRSFLARINLDRFNQGLPTTQSGKKGRNRGTRNRPISWKAVELMDKRAAGTPLDDSDRGNVSHARKGAEAYADRLRAALAKVNELFPENTSPGLVHSLRGDVQRPQGASDATRTHADSTNGND